MADPGIKKLDKPGLRNFSLVTSAALVGLFGVLLPWLFATDWPFWPWLLGAVLSTWGLIAPGTLARFYNGWMRFGLLLNKVTSPLVLGLAFFGIILPIGLIRRLGEDPLKRRFEPDALSYRTESHSIPRNNMEKPY